MFSLRTKWNMAQAVIFKNKPFYVQYYILSKCNLNCRMCNIVEGNSDLKDADLKTIEKIAVNLRKIGAGVILLTGGEPFLRKDLPEIIKILIDQGLNPRLQTAGFQTTREQLEACARAGAKDINISLDSIIPSKQDYINGSIANSWNKAIEAIVNSNDIFNDPDRVCALGTVLSKFNYMEIPALAELATYLGWYQSLVPVHITPMEIPLNFRGTDGHFKFNMPEDKPLLEALRLKLHAMKKEGYRIFDSDAYLDSTINFLQDNAPKWRKNGVCDSPSLYFAILPNGDFAVCCDHRFSGKVSVAQDNFPRLYKSAEFRDEVFGIAKACPGCNFGSYPEVTLSVRDPLAFIARAKTVLFSKYQPVPNLKLTEVYEFIEHLRNKYRIPDYDGPKFTVKPAALSQRYGEPEIKTRGPRKIPSKYESIPPEDLA
jgi:MoaA/NifB/PqqE/SkfB family radical SAM enzyme